MSTELNLPQGLLNWLTDFRAMWAEMGDTEGEGPYSMWTQSIDSKGESRISWAWLANQPKLRKWLGARIAKNPRLYKQEMGYDDWEGTMKLQRGLVDHDKTGAVKAMIDQYLRQIDAYDSAIAASMDSASGAGPTGFDGAALISASHPHSSSGGNQSNIAAGTALSHAALAAAEAAGMLFTQENGTPTMTQYTLIRGGPLLKNRMLELVSADRLVAVANDGLEAGTRVAAATRSNTFSGRLKVQVDPRVTTRFWDLIDENKVAKPMVLFKVKAPTPVLRVDPTDPDVFNHKEYTFGVEAQFGVAAGHWHTIFRGTGTA